MMTKEAIEFFYGAFAGAIHELALKYGGYLNAHAHLDRAGTLDNKYLEHCGTTPLSASSVPLRVKQTLTGELHKGPAYEAKNLKTRMTRCLKLAAATRIKRLVSFIDATPDIQGAAIRAGCRDPIGISRPRSALSSRLAPYGTRANGWARSGADGATMPAAPSCTAEARRMPRARRRGRRLHRRDVRRGGEGAGTLRGGRDLT